MSGSPAGMASDDVIANTDVNKVQKWSRCTFARGKGDMFARKENKSRDVGLFRKENISGRSVEVGKRFFCDYKRGDGNIHNHISKK